MSNNYYRRLLDRIEKVERTLERTDTNIAWLKWIIMGAAGLGFLEKFIGWLVK